jgi:molecular chaperone DnaK (HSP70)
MATNSIGIDFGTSTTLLAYRKGTSESAIIPLGQSTSWMPSVAALTDDGRVVVGEAALVEAPQRQIRSVKSALTNGVEYLEVGGREIEPSDVVSAILQETVRRAEKAKPGLFRSAKVYFGCPALWTGKERRLLADVAHSLGIDVDVADIIDEPVAAGLRAVRDRWLTQSSAHVGKTLIFDAGGGTLDIAYLQVEGSDSPEFRVLSAEGVHQSGDALDQSIASDLRAAIEGLADTELAELLLLQRSQQLKELLSFDQERELPLGQPYNVTLRYSRTQLEAAFESQMASSDGLASSVVRGAQLRVAEPLDPPTIRKLPWEMLSAECGEVLMVGGLSQIPMVRRKLAELFPRAEVQLVDRPQECVALGLAHGEQILRLNLPRPPVDFVVEYGPASTLERLGLTQWAHENRYLYRAYSPLYSPRQLVLGESRLGYSASIPYPDGCAAELQCIIYAQAPNREGTRLPLKVEGQAGTSAGIRVSLSPDRRGAIKLYTNGDLVVTGSRESLLLHVADWPRMRGPLHDWDKELRVQIDNPEWGSRLLVDDWRFN